jgi:hypothetical protein
MEKEWLAVLAKEIAVERGDEMGLFWRRCWNSAPT